MIKKSALVTMYFVIGSIILLGIIIVSTMTLTPARKTQLTSPQNVCLQFQDITGSQSKYTIVSYDCSLTINWEGFSNLSRKDQEEITYDILSLPNCTKTTIENNTIIIKPRFICSFINNLPEKYYTVDESGTFIEIYSSP